MKEQLFSLEDLAKLRAKEEEERSRLTYELYLKNFRLLVSERNPRITNSIVEPVANDRDEFVCIKEPYEFMHLFQGCSGQDESISLFKKLLEEHDERVVNQVIKNNPDKIWFNTTKTGINLRPGLKDEEWSSPVPITLGDDTVHALVAGRTGSGKSVFLNSIIFSLLAEYSPWEIDLYLADFKKVEFSRYLSKYDVPHIKAVAATSEIRYVISLLVYLAKTMKARQDFFALIGLQKLSEVRDKYSIVLPRVLLLVDEFQQLFLESTTREQTVIEDLLTSITKLGRATGFHLLFSSQEMSGTMSSSVFANFKARFALACDAEVSARVLGNSAASRIEKKGIVLANIGGSKEENNQLYKVPYISDEYFYKYLREITEKAEEYKFASVHKFYQEDSVKDIAELEKLLDVIIETRRGYLQDNSSLFDIITLGEAVVFNYKKYDYETFFIERGVRKNIGIFSPAIDDTVYVCKLLATNFIKSPISNNYKHLIFARNDLFMKKYDLAKDLMLRKEDVRYSIDFLSEMIDVFNKRCKEASLLNSFAQYPSLQEFAYDALCLRTEYIAMSEKEPIFAAFREIVDSYFENKTIQDIPDIKEAILDDYEFDCSYFRVLDMLYAKETEKRATVELFEPLVIWFIGAEMIGKFPKDMETVLTDSTNYNMLFISVASNNDFNDFHMLQKTCDYIFVSGNNESYYTKLRIPFTKKAENSAAIDFSISSSATQRSFKKFKYELKEIIVPEINFDQIMKNREK
ncbi:MAG: hypothetical protein IJY09_05655 [Lachnospiraceae bacterium]|nr:hypothetical protein [Lachnospiraceae bacterium]